MFEKIILLINIISLSLQIKHCLRSYEICVECVDNYFVVQNEWQYVCSHIENCIYLEKEQCLECSLGYEVNASFQCESHFKLIDNCRNYDEDDKTICIECIDGYALSNDHKSCKEYPNCRQLDKDDKCILCAKHYMLNKTGECVKSLCEEEDNGICTKCSEGYFLDDGKCHIIPIKNCLKFEEDLCTECFHFAVLSEERTECILDKLISGCNKVNEKDDTKCTHCSTGYELSEDNSKCQLLNCKKIEERCYQCEEGYFINKNGKTCSKSDEEEEIEEEKEVDNYSFYLKNVFLYLFVLVLFL